MPSDVFERALTLSYQSRSRPDPLERALALSGQAESQRQIGQERLARTLEVEPETPLADQAKSRALESFANINKAYGSTVGAGVRSMAAGFEEGAMALVSLGAKIIDSVPSADIPGANNEPIFGQMADSINRQRGGITQAAQQLEGGGFSGGLQRAVRGATGSLTQVAGAPGGSLGAIGTFAGTQANDAYTDAKDAGLPHDKAVSYALVEGALEGGIAYLFQKAGLGGLEDLKGGAPKAIKEGLKGFFKQLTAENVEEVATNVLQELYAGVAGVQHPTKASIWQNVKDTIAATTLTYGLAHGAKVVGERIAAPPQAPGPRHPHPVIAWAQAHPEQAQAVRDAPVPSREVFKEAGLDDAVQGREQREKFQEILRQEATTPPVDEATAPKGEAEEVPGEETVAGEAEQRAPNATKQSWEMTTDEFFEDVVKGASTVTTTDGQIVKGWDHGAARERAEEQGLDVGPTDELGQRAGWFRFGRNILAKDLETGKAHEDFIREAMNRGERIPSVVWDEHPELLKEKLSQQKPTREYSEEEAQKIIEKESREREAVVIPVAELPKRELFQEAVDRGLGVKAGTPRAELEEKVEADRQISIKRGRAIAPQENVVSGRYVDQDAIARELGLDQISSPENLSLRKAYAEARNQGIPARALDIANDVLNNKYKPDPTEKAGMVRRSAEIIVEARELKAVMDDTESTPQQKDQARQKRDVLVQNFETLREALRNAGAAASIDLNMHKMAVSLMKDNFEYVSLVGEAEHNKGKPLTKDELAYYEKVADDFAELEARIEGFEKKLKEATLKEFVDDAKRESKGRKRAPKELEDIDSAIEGLLRACDPSR